MGKPITFRLNPKRREDMEIITWLELQMQSSGRNQTDVIKEALLRVIHREESELAHEKYLAEIKEVTEVQKDAFHEVMKEELQNFASQIFAGSFAIMNHAGSFAGSMAGGTPVAVSDNLPVQVNVSEKSKETDTGQELAVTDGMMDGNRKSSLGSMFAMDDD